MCHIVGLPDAALSEARERVRSAIRNGGFSYPLSRITVNLAPADRRKQGAAFDVAIATGILVAAEQIRASGGPWALLGELSLDGSVRPIPGVLPMVATLREPATPGSACPAATWLRPASSRASRWSARTGLDDVARLVAGPRGRRAARSATAYPIQRLGYQRGGDLARPRDDRGQDADGPTVDLADVRGQAHARWALEVALAGHHNLLLIGRPAPARRCWLVPSPDSCLG